MNRFFLSSRTIGSAHRIFFCGFRRLQFLNKCSHHPRAAVSAFFVHFWYILPGAPVPRSEPMEPPCQSL